MSNFVLLVTCLVGGMLLRRFRRVPDNAHQTLNAIIVHVSLPAVSLRMLHEFRFEASHSWPVLMPWVLFAVGAGAMWIIGTSMRLPKPTIGALVLLGGLGNTSFVGLPMIESLYGRDGLGLGIVIDQLGSYLVLSTVGVTIAAAYAGGPRRSLQATLVKIATFPPLIALIVALILRPIAFPPIIDAGLARLGDTLAPLALLSVGLQLRPGMLRDHARLLGVGLGYKLAVCPAIVLLMLWMADANFDGVSRVTLIESAMPPMIGAGIVAADAGLDAPLVSSLIGFGIPLGLLTAVGWHAALQAVLG